MVLWPQLALWLNHQIEIISVTWVCGTPAWGFDRWDSLLYHLQTTAQGNSHQTSHLQRHTHTHTSCCNRTKCEVCSKNICRRKGGEKGREWKKYREMCEEKAWDWAAAPLLFSHQWAVYVTLDSRIFCAKQAQHTHHQYARPIEERSLVLIIAITPSRWVLNMHEMNITHLHFFYYNLQ